LLLRRICAKPRPLGDALNFELEDGMADHGHVEYATATGNDLAAHEDTYKTFVQLAFVGCCHVAVVVIGLAIVGTTSHWLMAVGLMVLATILAPLCLATGARAPMAAMLVIALLALGFAAAA
jgi:hypothetical protein